MRQKTAKSESAPAEGGGRFGCLYHNLAPTRQQSGRKWDKSVPFCPVSAFSAQKRGSGWGAGWVLSRRRRQGEAACRRRGLIAFLEDGDRLAAGEAGVGLVPVENAVFAQSPAEADVAALVTAGEVDQA